MKRRPAGHEGRGAAAQAVDRRDPAVRQRAARRDERGRTPPGAAGARSSSGPTTSTTASGCCPASPACGRSPAAPTRRSTSTSASTCTTSTTGRWPTMRGSSARRSPPCWPNAAPAELATAQRAPRSLVGSRRPTLRPFDGDITNAHRRLIRAMMVAEPSGWLRRARTDERTPFAYLDHLPVDQRERGHVRRV